MQVEKKDLDYIDENKKLVAENQLLLKELQKSQEKFEEYYLQSLSSKRKNESLQNRNESNYGSAERIKQQLSYRLGSQIIKSSRSVLGILMLPVTLLQVVYQYKKDISRRNKMKKLPPIHTYADYYKAKNLETHLSYMLGQTIIKSVKNPLGILLLPYRLYTTYKVFKKNR